MKTNEEKLLLADLMLNYCEKFNVPLQNLFQILEDQKVTPMIRGKAMEYNAYFLLSQILPTNSWSVQKLNLNAQTGARDEDISVTHRRTGVILKVECKSAVRGSIKSGRKSRKMKEPHFLVKCHRSRSNIELSKTSNDRYSVDSFDVIITNTENSIFQGNTVSENLEIIHSQELREMLVEHYNTIEDNLIEVCRLDWRFCLPEDIAEKGFIPRTPIVKLLNDENWKPLSEIEKHLLQVVENHRKKKQKNS